MILLDTDIMVDILRGYQPAINWLTSASDTEIGVPGLVAMELIQGCQNAREQKRLEKAINQLDFCTLKTEHSNSYQCPFVVFNRQVVATPNLPALRSEQRERAMQLFGA
jgi:predicted nucleic acid-binding protein